MGFFDKLKASVGFGGAKVDLIINEKVINQGGIIEGTVKITGGNLNQKLNKLKLQLYYRIEEIVQETVVVDYDRDGRIDDVEEHEHYDTNYITIFKTETAHNTEIIKGEEQEHPFTIEIPFNVPITDESIKWYLQAQADIPGAIDPRKTIELEIIPSVGIQAINELLEGMGFQMIEHGYEDESLFVVYKPTIQLKKFFDELIVYFYEDENKIELKMEIDLKERNVRDIFGSKFDTEQKLVRLTIPKKEIFTEEGNILHEVIEDYLKELFSSM